MTVSSIPCLLLACALAGPSASLPITADDDPPVETPKPEEKLEIGSTVPESLSLVDFEGKATSFKDLRGKVVLLHFWSYRCPAERHANPVFMEMEKAYADSEDVVMLGVVSNQNELGAKPAKGADFSEHYTALREKRDEVGYKHTILADHGNVVSDLFQARSTPHCFAIDKEGVIQYAGALDDDPRSKKGKDATNYLVDAAKAILAGRKPAVTTTKPYG